MRTSACLAPSTSSKPSYVFAFTQAPCVITITAVHFSLTSPPQRAVQGVDEVERSAGFPLFEELHLEVARLASHRRDTGSVEKRCRAVLSKVQLTCGPKHPYYLRALSYLSIFGAQRGGATWTRDKLVSLRSYLTDGMRGVGGVVSDSSNQTVTGGGEAGDGQNSASKSGGSTPSEKAGSKPSLLSITSDDAFMDSLLSPLSYLAVPPHTSTNLSPTLISYTLASLHAGGGGRASMEGW
uniref:Uncharacterized protein n=1 Tax=Palpitomonas bilix TaxID=652834 RepID=A0A7S3LVS3_9EUKA|mmetsp:Transcript_507/g.1041  ORF Transcript_507/g.1041 Transcript_507/m.1041 type:complete len:239 (+) Transcript_507:562-1278(+)